MADLPSNENLRFLARQPILTAKTLIFGYEILSRHGPENYFRPVPGGAPDVKAMDDLFLMGLKQMTNGLPAFLNCTRGFLLKDYLELMPRDMIVGRNPGRCNAGCRSLGRLLAHKETGIPAGPG